MCKKIHRGGNAEQYNADKKYKEAVAVAVEACADENTLNAASNYAGGLLSLKRFEEAKALLRKTVPVARRILGETHENTLKMRKMYAETLYFDPDATLDDLREAVTTLEEFERISRRVFGGAHPLTSAIKTSLRSARVKLRAREPLPPGERLKTLHA